MQHPLSFVDFVKLYFPETNHIPDDLIDAISYWLHHIKPKVEQPESWDFVSHTLSKKLRFAPGYMIGPDGQLMRLLNARIRSITPMMRRKKIGTDTRYTLEVIKPICNCLLCQTKRNISQSEMIRSSRSITIRPRRHGQNTEYGLQRNKRKRIILDDPIQTPDATVQKNLWPGYIDRIEETSRRAGEDVKRDFNQEYNAEYKG